MALVGGSGPRAANDGVLCGMSRPIVRDASPGLRVHTKKVGIPLRGGRVMGFVWRLRRQTNPISMTFRTESANGSRMHPRSAFPLTDPRCTL